MMNYEARHLIYNSSLMVVYPLPGCKREDESPYLFVQGKQKEKILPLAPHYLLGVGLVCPEGAVGTLGNTGEVPGLTGLTPWLI